MTCGLGMHTLVLLVQITTSIFLINLNVFNEFLQGQAPEVLFTINGTTYNMGYYLTYDIYPRCATTIKTIPKTLGEKRKLFVQRQEASRKDVERALGVLQSRFPIICGPTPFWSTNTLKQIMDACVILYNMIIEDEWEGYDINFDYSYDGSSNNVSTPKVFNHEAFSRYLEKRVHMCKKEIHYHLQANLVEHI